jgi:hypothetical protein
MKITANEFHKMILENPSVFEDWDSPLEITGYVFCKGTKITHLSKHLTFSGRNRGGECANFSKCKELKIATGTFHGFTNFEESGIEKIEDLHIPQTCTNGTSASFAYCKALQTASGTYSGFVNFQHTGIHSIQKLYIKPTNENDIHADFYGCHNLKTLKGWDIYKKFNIELEKIVAEKKRLTLQKILKEMQPKELPFL